MTRIDATRVVPASREDVFAFLSDLGNHWAVAGLRTGAFDRIVLGLGGAAWMRRLFAATLAHLAERFALAATSARA